MIIKRSDLAFKDIDDVKGIVTGYFASFNTLDADGDIFSPTAFEKSIKENGPQSSKNRIKHLLDHDRTKAVAVIQELTTDSTGLKYVSKAGNHTLGRDFLKMCQDGIITEHSVGINYIADKIKQDENGNNILLEVRMWEGSSLQSWGANENTPILSVKSLGEISDYMVNLEKCLKKGTYTDDTFIELEKFYAQIGEFLKLKKTTEPTSVIQPQEPVFDAEMCYKQIFNALKQQ